VLLVCLLASFASVQNRTYNSIDVDYRLRPLAVMGSEFYGWYRGAQFLLAVCIAPVFAASTMADEKKSGSLPMLLGSTLGPVGIVVSKASLAMLRVVELLVVGLPFAFLIVLLGGVEPQRVLIDLALILSVSFAGVGLGLLGGMFAASPAAAVQWSIATQLVWYAAPVIFTMIFSYSGAAAPHVWRILRLNVFCSLNRRWFAQGVVSLTTMDMVAAAGLCVAVGILCLGVVVVHLARTEGCTDSHPRSTDRKGGPLKARPDEPVWDRPALWRELRRRPLRRFEKVLCVLYVAAALSALTASLAYWEVSRLAIKKGQWMPDPPSLFVLEVTAALLLGFVAFPGQALAGAYAFGDERDKNLLDVWTLTSMTHRELVHAKLARLLLRGCFLIFVPASLGIPCVLLGWTTWTGLGLAWLLWCSAGLAATILGLATGIHAKRVEHAVWVTTGLTLILGALAPTAIFLANPTRTTTLYRWTTPTSPAMHGTFLLAVDFQASDQAIIVRRDFVDRIFSRSEFRTWALLWGAVNLASAAALYAWALLPPGGKDAGSRPKRRRRADRTPGLTDANEEAALGVVDRMA
jgi:hypothetical protein